MKSIFIGYQISCLLSRVGDRGGNRGGKDQFDWNNVKGDKYKDFYLGSSVRAGRQSTDVSWLFRDSRVPEADPGAKEKEEELKRIRQEEALLRKAELGLAPKNFKVSQENKLEQHELAELFSRGMTRTELDEKDPDRVAGLGFANTAFKDRAPLLPKEAIQSTLLEENYYPAPEQVESVNPEQMEWVEKDDSGKKSKKKSKKHKSEKKGSKKQSKKDKKEELKNFKKLYKQVRKESVAFVSAPESERKANSPKRSDRSRDRVDSPRRRSRSPRVRSPSLTFQRRN